MGYYTLEQDMQAGKNICPRTFEYGAPSAEGLCGPGTRLGSSWRRHSSVEIHILHYAMEDGEANGFSCVLSGDFKAKCECSCTKIQARGLWKLFSSVIELPETEPSKNTRT